MSGEPDSAKSGTPLYKWHIWTNNNRINRVAGSYPATADYQIVLSPSIPQPYSTLAGCMEWLRKHKITFFVEWLDA